MMNSLRFHAVWITPLLLASVGGFVFLAYRPSQNSEQLELTRTSVMNALEAWKAKKPSTTAPVRFHDVDQQRGAVLVSYQVIDTNTKDSDALPRCFVKLVTSRDGKTTEREVCYVMDQQKGVITRDPFY